MTDGPNRPSATPATPGVLADGNGHFTIAALDHRDALQAEFERLGPGLGGAGALRKFKRDVLDALVALGSQPSAVMLEPEYSLPELASVVPDEMGVTCALEAQGYFGDPSSGNRLMPGWTPARVAEVGADGAKLLVLYRHDRGEFTVAQERLVAEVITASEAAGVPILIEPVPFDVTDDADRRTVILASARRLSSLGGAVSEQLILKLPFPGVGSCEALTEASQGRPWILLSWGVTFHQFESQLIEACAGGASGFAVGRALWREAVDPAVRAAVLADLVPDRFTTLASIVATGRPWFVATGEASPSAAASRDEKTDQDDSRREDSTR